MNWTLITVIVSTFAWGVTTGIWLLMWLIDKGLTKYVRRSQR